MAEEKKRGKGSRNLTEGDIGASIRSMMLPMLVGMIALLSYNLVDTYFIGQLGTLELAAISFTFPVGFIVGAVTMGLGTGTAAVCSRLFGGKQFDEVERVAIHAILLGVMIGLLVVAAGISTIDPVFTLLGADDTTLPIIHRYIEIYYWGGIFLVVPMITNSVLRASGNAKTPALIMSFAALMNIILDPILIFGLFGFPRLDVEGAAIATVIANIGTMVASLYAIMFREHLVTFKHIWIDQVWDSWRRILHVGLPSTASSLIAPMTSAFITYQVSQFGQQAVAGFGVAARVEGLMIMAIIALGVAATPFVGQNFGAQQYERVRQGMSWCYRFSLIYGLSVAAILALAAPYIAGVFSDDPVTINTTVMHLRIVPISYLALGMAVTVNSSFNAIGKPMPAMFVSLNRTILCYAPLAFLFAREFGLIGIFAAACTANFIAGTVGRIWFRLVFDKTVAVERQVLKV